MMTKDEYNLLFHKCELNRVAFKPLMECDDEVIRLVKTAVEAERKRIITLCNNWDFNVQGLVRQIQGLTKSNTGE